MIDYEDNKEDGRVVSFKMGPRLEQTGPALVNF